MIHQLLAGPPEARFGKARLTILTDGVREGEFQQIADRDPEPGLALTGKEEAGAVLPCRFAWIGFVGQQVAIEDGGGVFAQQAARESNPGIFPDPALLFTQKGVKFREQLGAEIAAPRPQSQIFVVVRISYGNRQVNIRPVAFHRDLEFILHADRGIGPGKSMLAAGVQNLLPELFSPAERVRSCREDRLWKVGARSLIAAIEGIRKDFS